MPVSRSVLPISDESGGITTSEMPALVALRISAKARISACTSRRLSLANFSTVGHGPSTARRVPAQISVAPLGATVRSCAVWMASIQPSRPRLSMSSRVLPTSGLSAATRSS